MAYKIDNAIIKKDRNGKLTLIDPENVFGDEDAFIAVKSEDLITIQLLINGIMKNDFKTWKELGSIPDNEPLKSLFVRLGYSREYIAKFVFLTIARSVSEVTNNAMAEIGKKPILISGGVAGSSILGERFNQLFSPVFGTPALSADNAAGIAILASIKENR